MNRCTIIRPMLCPKCELEQADTNAECPRCGIVFARFLELRAAAQGQSLYRPAPAPRSAEEDEELRGLAWWRARDVPGYHDWENILITLDLMQHDTALGAASYGVGRVLMIAAFGWGGWVLSRQWPAVRAGA